MAIDTITPAADSVIENGASLSFKVDDTYTTITIEVETSGGYEYAYDGALGGAQSGYVVTVVASGGRHTFTVTRSAGWDLSPFNFRVVENETGSDATTTTSYVLSAEQPYPQGQQPYNAAGVAGNVTSFEGRSGPVVSAVSDYDASEIDNDSGVTGTFVSDALDTLAADIAAAGGGAAGGLGTWAYAALGSVSTKFSASADDLSTVTYFLVSDDNTELSEMSLALAALPAGANLFIWDTADETRCAQYTLGTVTDQAGYTTVPVTFVAETAGTGSAVTDEEWRFYVQPIADTDTSDHGALTGLTDDDHVRYVDVAGTREQDAVFFDYRADHVNAPAAGKAEIWVAPKGVLDSPMFTDSTGTDWTIARGSAMNDSEIPFWVAGVNGDYLFTSSGFTYASGELFLGGGTADLGIAQRAAAPTPVSGVGYLWVKSDADTTLWFTDDAGTDFQLGVGSGSGDVVGPASAGDDRIATFDTASGKLIQDTAVAIEQTTGVITNVGTTAMLVLAEQTGSMPSHSAGYGKLWVDNTAPTSLMFTDDVSTDHPVVLAPTSVGNDRLVTWDGTTGHYVQSTAAALTDNGALVMTGSTVAVEMAERSSAPSNSGGYGKFWVKNDAPTTPWFTDDVSTDTQLALMSDIPTVGQQVTLASNELVSLDATEVVVGGGYIDGSTGGTYSWEILGTYNDGGGGGNQDMEVRLYDRGPDGTPVAGVLRSVIEITSLDTFDRVSQALTVASSPGVDADEIDADEPRLMEVRIYMDATGGVDTGHLLSCTFTES